MRDDTIEEDEHTPLLSAVEGQRSRARTPLSTRQMMMVLVVTFVEPVQFGILFPFMYFMVRDFHVTNDDRALGFYVGILASTFCVAQLFSALPWGWVSDRIGRRPVILIGLVGNAVTCALFGASESYMYSICLRTLCGLLNGNLGVVKTMLGEMTDDTNRGIAFAYWESAFGIGSIVGPILGGLLVNPVEQFPSVFGSSFFFKRFPYLLPCLVSSAISLLGALAGYIFMEETLVKKKSRSKRVSFDPVEHPSMDHQVSSVTLISNPSSSDEGTFSTQVSSASLDSLIDKTSFSVVMTRKVATAILAYATWSLIQVMYEEVYAVYVATSLSLGGLSFTSADIGLAMSLEGICQVFVQLIVYPALELRWGKKGTFRFAAITMVIFSALLPFVTDVAIHYIGVKQDYTPSQKTLVFAVLMFVLTGRFVGCVCGYIPVMVFVNDSSPYKESLGTVHGFGQMAASFVRYRQVKLDLQDQLLEDSFGHGPSPTNFHFLLIFISLYYWSAFCRVLQSMNPLLLSMMSISKNLFQLYDPIPIYQYSFY